MILNFSEYTNKVEEGLIKTYDIEFVINRLSLMFFTYKIKADVEKIENVKISVKFEDFYFLNRPQQTFELLYSFLINISGYFPSYLEYTETTNSTLYKIRWTDKIKNKLIKNQDLIKVVRIVFEPKFDKIDIIPSILYHISIQEYKDKILKKGLYKNKITNHPDRIYVCKDPSHCMDLLPQMKFSFFEERDNDFVEKNKNFKWIIYKILTNDINCKLYKDPNYIDKGFYLLSHIPPQNIGIYKEEK